MNFEIRPKNVRCLDYIFIINWSVDLRLYQVTELGKVKRISLLNKNETLLFQFYCSAKDYFRG